MLKEKKINSIENAVDLFARLVSQKKFRLFPKFNLCKGM